MKGMIIWSLSIIIGLSFSSSLLAKKKKLVIEPSDLCEIGSLLKNLPRANVPPAIRFSAVSSDNFRKELNWLTGPGDNLSLKRIGGSNELEVKLTCEHGGKYVFYCFKSGKSNRDGSAILCKPKLIN